MLAALLICAVPSPDLTTIPDAGYIDAATWRVLDGRRVRVRGLPGSLSDRTDDGTSYELEAFTGVAVTVWLPPDSPYGGPVEVEGRMYVVDHPTSVWFGQRFEGFTEARMIVAGGGGLLIGRAGPGR